MPPEIELLKLRQEQANAQLEEINRKLGLVLYAVCILGAAILGRLIFY